MHVRLIKTFNFEAAHYLPSFPEGHKCRRMHGHSFKVDVVIAGRIASDQHHLIDYAEIAAAIQPLYEQLDHRCLNDIPGLENPTSEMVAKWLWDRLTADGKFARKSHAAPALEQITVYETCTSRCEYRGE